LNSKEKGNFGEFLAQKYLEKKGYKIIDKNFSTRFGEVDLIAIDGNYIVFIEVRMRSRSAYEPEESISIHKVKKIIKTAQIFLYKKKINSLNVRFDVISIMDNKIKHIQNAFDMDFL